MIARLTVQRGSLTEFPLAERVKNGWQNGVTFYPDQEVTAVTELIVSTPEGNDLRLADNKVDELEVAFALAERTIATLRDWRVERDGYAGNPDKFDQILDSYDAAIEAGL